MQCVNKTTPSHNHTIAHTCMLTQLHPLATLLPALSALHQRELHLVQAGFSPKPRSLSSIQTRPIRILHSASRRLLLLIKLKRRKGSTLSRMRRLLVLLIFFSSTETRRNSISVCFYGSTKYICRQDYASVWLRAEGE